MGNITARATYEFRYFFTAYSTRAVVPILGERGLYYHNSLPYAVLVSKETSMR